MLSKVKIESNIVSVDWLKSHLETHDLLIFNATIPKVVQDNSSTKTEKIQIPGTQFFDLKQKFSDLSSAFPNTIPSEVQFENEAQKLGVNHDSAIIVYDDKGMYSSARVWWLFKTFGFHNVAVLDGGLPEWLAQGYKTEHDTLNKQPQGNFKAVYNPNNVVYIDSINAIAKDVNFKIIDARSSDRFNCLVEEPRAGLRSGTISNSINLPYSNLFNGFKLKSIEELKIIFNDLVTKDKSLVFTCGSGITASILSLVATILGYKNSVYDGSWTEYGTLKPAIMEHPNTWTKDELLAYILLFVAHSDLEETKDEKHYIVSRVDKTVYKRVHEQFEKDNDYQSIQNIIEAVKSHDYYRNDLADLFADIKLMAFADGDMNQMELTIYNQLKKVLL